MKTIINKISKKLNFPFQENKAKIEYLGLGKITGWVFNRKINLTEVRLVLGNKIVSKSNVEIERGDVCQKYNYQGKPGFELKLPTNLKNIDKDANIKIIALSSDGQKIFECISKGKRKKIYQKIREILNSPYLGIHGNLDGIQSDGLIHGWASWIYLKKVAWVWLQCEGIDPSAFKCNHFREEVSSLGFKTTKVGFKINPQELNKICSQKSYYISFDKEGKYKLPSKKTEYLPIIFSEDEIYEPNLKVIEKNKNIGYLDNINNSPKNLKNAWKELENFRTYLNGIERELNKLEYLNNVKKELTPRKNFLKKLKNNIVK